LKGTDFHEYIDDGLLKIFLKIIEMIVEFQSVENCFIEVLRIVSIPGG
jgi:hypothetical protein